MTRAKIAIAAVFLLVLGVYILRFSPISYPILRHSARQGYYYIVATQLALGIKGSDRTAFQQSIHNNQPAIAELLIRHGADIEDQWMSGEPNGPPLAWALMHGESDIAKMLLHHGARADYKPRFSGTNTALHMAVELNDAELVRLLLKNGADPSLSDQSGVTPFMVAATYRRTEIEDILRRAGAKDSPRVLRGTPEHYCIMMRNAVALPKRP